MIRTAWIAGLIALAALGTASPALAGKARSDADGPRRLLEGRFVAAPLSFTKFCMDYPSDCPDEAGATRVHLAEGQRSELEAINREVNASIEPTPDGSQFRFWRLGVSAGDCNAFAVQKRHELLERGWPAGALALTVVKTAWGEGHLVLTVRTDAGDLVLDNLRDRVVSWDRTGYRWVMRQSERNPQYWALLNAGRAARTVGLNDDAPDAAATDLATASPAAPAPSRKAKAALPGRHFDRALDESVSDLGGAAPALPPTLDGLWSGANTELATPAQDLAFTA